jgi:hypothetical protein
MDFTQKTKIRAFDISPQKVFHVIVHAFLPTFLLWQAKEITYAEREIERTVLRVDRGNFSDEITYVAYTGS